ncbi:MAG: acyl-CoA dehydrogenase family protein [Myxococcales bacterium]
MDFQVPDEIAALCRTVRGFVDREVDPLAGEIEETDRIPQRLVESAKALGLFGLSIPEEYGGLGLGVLGRSLVYEVLGRTSAGFTSLVGAHTGIGTSGIAELGSADLKRRYLPRLASGEMIAGFALSEPNAGSDAARITTTAVRRGDRFILDGRKHYITNGPDGQLFTVIAVTDKGRGTKGISAFAVESRFKGFHVGRVDQKMGLHGSHTSELIFEGCEVPAENLIGEEGLGYVAALKILTKGRATLAARCVGACERLVELSVAYGKERQTMGKPIIEHQLVQAMVAEMATDTAAARALTRQVAWMADQGQNIVKEAAMAKLFASEALARVADKAVQVFGGMGYMREMEVERHYRDARITRIYEGSSEIQKLIIARRLVEES